MRIKHACHTLLLFGEALFLTACAVGPDFKKPEAPTASRFTVGALPQETAAANTQGGSAQSLKEGDALPADWWTLFQNPVLNKLVQDALLANPDLAAAAAALKAAKADAAAQRAAFFPAFGAGFETTRQKTSDALSPVLASPSSTFNLYTPQVSVSYTPDLFGGVRRAQESADATARAQRFALEAARLTLVSNIVLATIAQASLTDQIHAQQVIVAGAEQQSQFLEDQVRRGGASRVALEAQNALTSQAEAQLTQLQKQAAQQQDQLAALSGRLPSDFAPVSLTIADIALPHALPLSVPASLVRRRPDVRIAEENLHAANAQVGVAIAQMLPSLTLTAGAGSAATAIGSLFSPGMGFWNIGAGLAQPLFDGGALLNRKRAADARLEGAKAQYRSAVVTAFQNTADALEAIASDAKQLKVAADAEGSAARSLQMTRRQREVGDIAMPALLLAEQSYQQTKITLIQARAARYADTVALFAALGGGWWERRQEQAAEQP
jgi:NodT family efflux transporter outer membrane factor (OMF) lipoprotein